MNKYYQTLDKILQTGKIQTNRKGRIKYLLNERLMLTPADLLDIFESHGIARKKLKEELKLFMQGVRDVEKYKEAGITSIIYPSLRISYWLINMEDEGLPFPGSDFFELITAYQTPPDA